jgi:HEAT repeat protein
MGQRLAPSSEIARHLAENVVQDPQRGVRFQSLLALIAEPRDGPEIAAALREACLDPAFEIRLHAAKELGAEGHGVLLEVAENAEDDELTAEAVSALNRDGALPFERANAILDMALRRRRLRTARACVEALVPGRDKAVEKLAKVLKREQGELALAAAGALAATGAPAAEPPLIQALPREDPSLRKAVVEALGRMGTAAAVLPLQEAGELADRDLRRAARQAIDAIQSRLQGASPGQLSLARAEAGQLSLAQDGGELSLADDPAGRLSLEGEET